MDRTALCAPWLLQTGLAFQRRDQIKPSLQLLGVIMAISDPSPTVACNLYWRGENSVGLCLLCFQQEAAEGGTRHSRVCRIYKYIKINILYIFFVHT